MASRQTAPERTGEQAGERPVTLFLCGDVMTGRGIDQILPHPVDPVLYEPYVQDARQYVALAEQTSGPVAAPVDFHYIWGDALPALARLAPDVRIINLETSVTRSEDRWRTKDIHYRMHPGNVPCLTAARIDVCALANNHVLDWGYPGLLDTLTVLREAGVKTAGAGREIKEAAAPAVIEVAGKGRVLVMACGLETSGVPSSWGASSLRPGVYRLRSLSPGTVQELADQVRAVKQPGDVMVLSIHWGPNWGYQVPREERAFAAALIDEAGIDVVHGHSSHHVKGIEVHNDRLILYGCGDFLNDYEGISGYESFRGDLGLMYLPTLETSTGRLLQLRLIPTRIRSLRVNRASIQEALWLQEVLNREGRPLGTRVTREPDDSLTLRWG